MVKNKLFKGKNFKKNSKNKLNRKWKRGGKSVQLSPMNKNTGENCKRIKLDQIIWRSQLQYLNPDQGNIWLMLHVFPITYDQKTCRGSSGIKYLTICLYWFLLTLYVHSKLN